MNKKTFALIAGITGGLATIAGAIVSFLQPAFTPAIVAAIGIAETAVIEICNLFVIEETK
ncbi:MAG: hypothetical protein MJ168_10905 [Clostridia bacterium]|nr:hypothetical protein [Clostridia bacterium]